MFGYDTKRFINSKKESAKIHKRARALNSGGEGHAKHAEKTGKDFSSPPGATVGSIKAAGDLVRELNKAQPARDEKVRRILAKFAPDPIPYDAEELVAPVFRRETISLRDAYRRAMKDIRDAEKRRKQ